jgi:hypothetical protein
MSKQTNATTPVLGWTEAAPVTHEAPRLLATLRAPRKQAAPVADDEEECEEALQGVLF